MADELDVFIETFTAILEQLLGGKAKNTNTKTTTKDILSINATAAKTLLDQVAKDAQYTGKLSKDDITAFVNDFNKRAQAQAEVAVRNITERIKPGAKPEDITNIINNYVTTTSLSFLDPKNLAQDYIWSKINFADEKTLGGKSLSALQDVRALIRNNGILDVSDIEVQNTAKKIARGEMTLDEYRATLQAKVILNYPQFADRFKNNPNASAREIFSPYINTMAKVLEKDPNEIQLDNLYLDKALRPDGAAGKLLPMSISDFIIMLKNTPDYDNTRQSNEDARSAATAFGRAWGFGV
jgi:polyhydroxyalkanoate synthesis regulator phasin